MNTRSRFQRFVVMLAAVLFVFGVTAMPTPSYHNIDMVKARDKAREYARKKVDDRNRNYEHFSTDCTPAFEGHNHYARCVIFYKDAERRQLCKERIEVFLPAHPKSPIGIGSVGLGPEHYIMRVKNVSPNAC